MTRRQLLKAAARGWGTSLLQGILATVVGSRNVTAQTVIEIRRGPADVATAGIKLVTADDPEYAPALQMILADDAPSMAPLRHLG